MKNISGEKTGIMWLRNRNFSTAFCSHFFTLFKFYSHFPFSKRIFSHFFQAHVQNAFFHFFSHFSQKCENNVKNMKKCILKMRLGKKGKNAFWRCTWKKNVKNKCWKMWKKVKHVKTVKKCENCEKCEKMWKKTHLKIQLGRWNLDFLGSSFAAVTLLPAQLRQVENRRGAIQIDRKCTVQIADLFTISIAKQWLPGAKT